MRSIGNRQLGTGNCRNSDDPIEPEPWIAFPLAVEWLESLGMGVGPDLLDREPLGVGDVVAPLVGVGA